MRNPLLTGLKGLQKFFGGSGLGQVKPLRWAYDSAFSLLKPKFVAVQGHRMWLDKKDALELSTREIYEPLETALLKKELLKGQTFLDVGANIGYYTLLAARITGPQGRVFAFEPDPGNFELLKKNMEENGYSKTNLIPQAVSSKTGTQRLFLNETNQGDHQLFDSGEGRKAVRVKTTALDDFFKRLDKKVHFIKMDIQGSEAAALQGMRRLLGGNRHLKLVTEFWPYGLSRAGSSPRQYLLALKKMGFRLFEISEKEKTFNPVRPDYLLGHYPVENRDYTNLFCEK